ncbi:MAG: hypothetical protein R3C20_22820 [Planctomycetaceae bacterium]
MKAGLMIALLLWMTLCVELAWPDRLPSGCLMIPLAVAAACWLRNSLGVVLFSFILLLSWIARPVGLPLAAIVSPIIIAAFLLRTGHSGREGSRVSVAASGLLQLPLLVVLVSVLHQAAIHASGFQGPAVSDAASVVGHQFIELIQALVQDPGRFANNTLAVLLIAVPFSVVLNILLVLSDELGLRRNLQAGRDIYGF